MPIRLRTTLTLLAACGIVVASANADEPYQIEITDTAPDGYVGTSAHDPNCKSCPENRAYNVGNGTLYTHHTGPNVKRARSPLHVFLAGDGSHTYSPDYGWRRPAKIPVLRASQPYWRMHPNYWHGQAYPNGAHWKPTFPMVYTPTDTTQLGYTYNHVPTWQPNPAMIPPPVWPTQWHVYEKPHGHAHRHNVHQHVGSGVIHHHGPTTTTPTPVYSSPTPVITDGPGELLPAPNDAI